MRLKQIQLQGFKSFYERTVLNFPDEITCIVGPNGCGKSNLVDAIRWVLGEQSSKQLRGESMEDVIFHGTDEIPPTGMAEVTLIFDNRDGLCPAAYLNFPEIQVTRRLFRNGESEYYINRTPCRLKDITDLFLGSGIGTKAYSIVEQGSIEKIITMKPEQRRLLIEEAAGVSKYRVRREEALRKMEATRQNLLRIRDIISELQRQMNSLHRQAKKAERYKQYRDELRELELELAALRGLDLKERQRTLEERLARLQERESELTARRQQAEADIEQGRTALLERERLLNACQVKALEAAREVETHDRALALLAGEQNSLEQNLQRLAEEQEDLAARERNLAMETAACREEEEKRQAGLGRAEEAARQAEEICQAADCRYGELVEVAAVLEKHAHGLLTELEKLKERREWTGRRAAELEERKSVLLARSQKLEEKLESQSRINLNFNEKLYQLRKEAAELRQAATAAEEELAAHKSRAAAVSALHADIASRLQRARSRLASLEEMERNFEGYERGVKAIMERKARLAEQGQNGIYRLIAEVVSVEPQYELALEALLGDRLQAIVVEDSRRALENIFYLRERDAGRSSFLPRHGIEPRPVAVPPGLREMGAVPLAEQITATDEYRPLVQVLVGDALVVDDLEAAARRRAEIGASYPLVTRDGVVMDSLGVMSGGSKDSYPGFLAKKREMAELQEQVRTLADEESRAEAELAEWQGKIREEEDRLAELKEKLYRFEIEKNNLEKDLRQGTEAYNALLSQQSQLVAEEEELARQEATLRDSVSELVAAIARHEEDRMKLEEELSRRRSALQEMEKERALARARLSALQGEVAALVQKEEALRREQERLATAGEEFCRRREKLDRQQESTAARLQELAAEAEERRRLKAQAVHAAKEVEAAALSARNEYEEAASGLREKEKVLKSLYEEREQLQEEKREVELALADLHPQLDSLRENIADKYDRELAEVMEEYRSRRSAEYPWEERKARREELREKMARMGEVNPTAWEEFQEISQRHSFLSNQEADLLTALDNLELTIAKINTTYRREFKKTFDQVNAHFQELFSRLFNGGKAMLILTDADNLLDAGVEIMAQPPGKKMSSIALLSGGEKALTSAGLILALFLVKPSPFCLLDEVDAALDDVNIGRFVEAISQLARNSQLILITHNKLTMELACTLYGVTMEKDGISRIVSVRLKKETAESEQESTAPSVSPPAAPAA